MYTPSEVVEELEFAGNGASSAFPEAQIDAFVASLRACTKRKDLRRGSCIHDDILQRDLLERCSDALVTMYAKCGDLAEAKALLDVHKSNDPITWTALIAGYARRGQGQTALDCFKQMQSEGILPDAVTYACILKACATIGAIDKGKQIHDAIARQGLLQNDVVLGGALVDMYVKCGDLSMAQRVLEGLPSRNVVAWNALIAGHAHEGQAEQALIHFEQMQHEGLFPDAVTYACILKACATIGAVDKGEEIHNKIARQGLLQNNVLLGVALVDMYAKCGALSMAQSVLEGLPFRNVVSWSALIAGYAQEGRAEQALSSFGKMQSEGILPDAVTYACVLKACATIGAVDKGREIHENIVRQGLLENNVVLGGALVDMYAKCGALLMARCVLEGLSSRNVVSWSALIAGYAQQGQAEQALNCFKRMQHEGILPNAVTFSCVLSVCSHLGLVEEGQAVFMNMSTNYDVKPDLECYTCMVDLFGRAGHIEKAVRLIQEMPSSDYSVIWFAILGACHKWRDVNAGRWAFERAVGLDRSDGPAYILMANMYAAAGMHENAKSIEAMRIRYKAWEKPSHSGWAHGSDFNNDFSVGDIKLARTKCIHAQVENIAHKLPKAHSLGLHGVSLKALCAAKKHLLSCHSDKLALGCALSNTLIGETLKGSRSLCPGYA